ncbi:MAG: hypothetical protein RSC52_03530, partial [Oscillospiraceae bacterium]
VLSEIIFKPRGKLAAGLFLILCSHWSCRHAQQRKQLCGISRQMQKGAVLFHKSKNHSNLQMNIIHAIVTNIQYAGACRQGEYTL